MAQIKLTILDPESKVFLGKDFYEIMASFKEWHADHLKAFTIKAITMLDGQTDIEVSPMGGDRWLVKYPQIEAAEEFATYEAMLYDLGYLVRDYLEDDYTYNYMCAFNRQGVERYLGFGSKITSIEGEFVVIASPLESMKWMADRLASGSMLASDIFKTEQEATAAARRYTEERAKR